MDLTESRRAIQLLLNERRPADAMAAYYAFYYPEEKSQLVTYPLDAGPGKAAGYVAFSRTGMDLFRPYVTLRLPINDMAASVDLACFSGDLRAPERRWWRRLLPRSAD